jgi:hypothetical protein
MIADSSYEIVINPTKTIRCSFQEYLFNQPFYLQKQPCKEVYSFYLIHKKNRQAWAKFNLFVQEKRGFSPCRGPFGAIEMNPLLPVPYLDNFVQHIDAFAAKLGLREILIKSYPFCYNPEASAIITASLLRLHYQILYTDLNYHIPVTQRAFIEQVHLSEKRRLKKCVARGFSFGEEPEPDFALIYQMLVNSRHQKGYPVSMSFSDFRQLFADFPGIYKLFVLKDKQRTIAFTVAVEITKQVLYYFLPAHDPAYNTYSPMVYLIQNLYGYCQKTGYTLLDLGISTDKSVPNYGLMRFKQNLGASVSLKLSFVKSSAS